MVKLYFFEIYNKNLEVEKNGYEENIFMEEEIIQENTNIYKKTLSEKTKRKIQNVDSDQKRKDPEDEVIDYEFQLLMEQRKALENELEELKKLQDITRKGSPFKKKGEKQIRNDFKEEMTIQRPDFVK